jgi:MFS family permease
MRDSELFSSPRVVRAPHQIIDGLSYLRRRFDLLIPILLVGVIGTLSFNFQITLALMDKTIFHKGAAAYGLLSSCIAAGSLIGALIGARRTQPTRRLLIGGALVFGLLQLCVGLMPTYVGVAAVLVPTGLAAIFFSTAANSMVQLNSDPEMRGRVMGVYMLVFAGGTPIGAPLVGWMAQEFGARSAMWLGGAAAIAVSLFAAVLAIRQQAPASRFARRATSFVGTRVVADS